MDDVKGKLQWPAIGLIIVGALNALSGLVLILGRLVSLVKGQIGPLPISTEGLAMRLEASSGPCSA